MANRPIQSGYTRAYTQHTLLCIGDSMVDNSQANTAAVMPDQQWPALVASKLRTLQGCNIQARNLGMSGSRTQQLVARLASIFKFGVPDIVAIFCGLNDVTVQGGFTAQAGGSTTTVKLSASDFREDNFCVGQTITFTGGTASGGTGVIGSYNGATQIATIASGTWGTGTPDATTTYQWEVFAGAGTQTNLTTAIQYCLTNGVSKVLLLDTMFDNSSTGETVGSPNATHATLRTFQLAAANSFSVSNPGQVIYTGLWTYLGNLINNTGGVSNVVTVNGTAFTVAPNADTTPAAAIGYTPGSATPGVYGWGLMMSSSNGHMNQIGHMATAQNVYNTIIAQTGWVASLIP